MLLILLMEGDVSFSVSGDGGGSGGGLQFELISIQSLPSNLGLSLSIPVFIKVFTILKS